MTIKYKRVGDQSYDIYEHIIIFIRPVKKVKTKQNGYILQKTKMSVRKQQKGLLLGMIRNGKEKRSLLLEI